MNEPWDPASPGVLKLPSGRLVRGRGLKRPAPKGPVPTFGVYLLGRRPPAVAWESRWLRWPDFGLPADQDELSSALTEAWRRAGTDRVEVACAGGHGRTGTALACLAILDGLPSSQAVAFVREYYDRHAVETHQQAGYVSRFSAGPLTACGRYQDPNWPCRSEAGEK
jgi:Protein-tyrosine phosphatase